MINDEATPSGYPPTGFLCGFTTSDLPRRRSTFSLGFSFPASLPSSTSSTGPTFSPSNRTMDLEDTLTKILLQKYSFFYADRANFRVSLSNVYNTATIFSHITQYNRSQFKGKAFGLVGAGPLSGVSGWREWGMNQFCDS